MKSRCRDIQDICEELNGKDCTPGEYSLEKIAKAGSWLALDILLEGIYKGAQKTEKIYYDIFFEVKDQASVERLGEFNRLAADKKEVFRESYIIPQLQKEPKNRVLWHLLCLSSDNQKPLEELQKANLDSKEKLELVLYLDVKFKLEEDRKCIDSYILELLEQQDAEANLSYERCWKLLAGEAGIQSLKVERLLWKNMILHNAEITQPLNGFLKTDRLPDFWKKMELILIRCRQSPNLLEIANVMKLQLKDIVRNEENIHTLQQAVNWMEEKDFAVEAAFLQVMICPQKDQIQHYIHTLWKEPEAERIKWMRKHGKQFYVFNWMRRYRNTRTLCHMQEADVLRLTDVGFQDGCQQLKNAIEEKNWDIFWKWSQLGDTSCSPFEQKNLLQYLTEINRADLKVEEMSDEELGTFLFLTVMLKKYHELNETLEHALKCAYEEYTKREWNLCWINIWARHAAIHLLNQQNKTDLFSSKDIYKAFINTEEAEYLYQTETYFTDEPEKLWKNLIWMLSAVEIDHMIFRVIPALALCMPTVSLQFQGNSYRQLLSVICQENLRELGRLFFLMLIPDWTEEERELLADQIMHYIKASANECVRLFLHFMDRYPIENTLQRMIYENLYRHLNENNAWNSVQGRKLLAEVCESAYLKVQESNTL